MNQRISYLCSKCRFEGSRQCDHCVKGDLFMESQVLQGLRSSYGNYKVEYRSYSEKIRKSLTNPLAIKNVIFNEPATIVFWADGTKTVVKCQDGDVFDPEKGLAMAFMKKVLGNKGNYFETVKKWVPEEIKEDVPEWVKTHRENLENEVVFPCAGCGKWHATNCLYRPCEKLESYNKALDALKESN